MNPMFNSRNHCDENDGLNIRFLKTVPGFNAGDEVRLSRVRAERFVKNGDAEIIVAAK